MSDEQDKSQVDQPDVTNHYEEKREVFEEKKINPIDTLSNAFYMYPYEYTANMVQGYAKGTVEQQDAANIISQYAPKLIFSDRVTDGSVWTQELKFGDRILKPSAPRLRSTGGTVTGQQAIELYTRSEGIGGSITFFLPHSGIWLTAKPADESVFISAEFKLQHASSRVGTSTVGLLLNARSAVFSDILIDIALDHVVSSSAPFGASELSSGLKSIIDPLDYSILCWSVLATKYVNGHPWEFRCASPDCEHSRFGKLNFGRMLWFDQSALTEDQLKHLATSQNGATLEQILKYQEGFVRPKTDRVATEHGTIFKFGHTNIDTYINSAKRWVDDLERAYHGAITNYSNEKARAEFLDGLTQSYRMLRYQHLVEEILIPLTTDPDPENPDDYSSVQDADTIRQLLIKASTTNSTFDMFEAAAEEWIEQSTVGIVGYPAKECPSCHFDPAYTKESTEDEPTQRFRTLVPVATDRVLFTLVQQKNTIMAALAKN